METAGRLRKKWFMGTLVGGTVCLLAWLLQWAGAMTIAELKALDHRFHHYADATHAGRDIVLVAIDDASLEAYGRWPWSRDRHGYVVNFLKRAGAKAVVFDLIFSEPDTADEQFDQVFADEMRAAGNVYLPFLLEHAGSTAPSSGSPEPRASLPALPSNVTAGLSEAPPPASLPTFSSLRLPTPLLAQAARGLGYINLTPDQDGTTRRLPPLARVGEDAVLQLAARVARDVLQTDRVSLNDRRLQIGSATIPLTVGHAMLIDWHGSLDDRTYPMYSMGAVLRSFTDLQQGKPPLLDPTLFKEKIVFVAATAAGTYDLRVTPLSPIAPGVLIHMSALDNILRNRFLRPAPAWVDSALTLVLCLATAWAFILVSGHTTKLLLIAGMAGAYYALSVHAFTSHELWLDLALPLGALGVTFAATATVEYLTEGRQRRQLRTVFDKYMAADVVDEIMKNPERIRLGGEKKELTVLFSDVAGFTSISEKLDPEALVVLLNKYLSAMTDIILKHRGNVNKYLGDGIMAIFGAPRGDPQHASLACYAALDSQTELAKLREQWKREGHPEISARIGINSGPLVVGNMGSQRRLEYTVMGDSVNLASRLEGANKYYDTLILLGPRTYELARQDIEAREVDLMRVKGKHEPVVVYELLARKGALPSHKQLVGGAYLEGLRVYKSRNFKQAVAKFEAALTLDPNDGPSRIYLQRAQEFLATPPPPEWDGVYELKTK
ncbi:MAG: adenylate/guanylate cyclase domain-containing protein [Nitrospira sp.]|nr:MAG: adenylate/guanylate cyclase domain-containing protein [Nitrospira sp.]